MLSSIMVCGISAVFIFFLEKDLNTNQHFDHMHFEDFDDFLEKLKTCEKLIVVEGVKDKNALESLGIANIFTLDCKPIFQVVEERFQRLLGSSSFPHQMICSKTYLDFHHLFIQNTVIFSVNIFSA